jgi:DNA-binding phage protein
MSIDTLIQQFGGPTQMAKALGVTRQSIYYWKKRGGLPKLRQMQAELKIKEADQ